MDHDPNDYDETSFASIMRRIFANVMHTYDETWQGERLFKEVHRRVVPVREKCMKAYNSQEFSRSSLGLVSIEQIGIAALNLINDGRTPEQVARMGNGALLKRARKAKKRGALAS